MSKTVPYARQTLDNPNPIARFAHRSRYKVSLDLAGRFVPEGGSLVDFGAGQGAFLDQFGTLRPDATLVAIEPYMTIANPQIERTEDLADIAPSSVDVVSAFEVLEHVSDADLDKFLTDARRALKPAGTLVVTVPIMYGPVLPVKELSRALLHRRMSDTGPWEMLKATFGVPITRPEQRRPTHKGFDFRWLDSKIADKFDIFERGYSPFAALPWWLNSQAIFVAAKR
jgi:SAM-dependent methyltransferase